MRQELIKTLESYTPFDEDEASHVEKMLKLLKNYERCFWRDHFEPGHMTGAAFLLNKTFDKTLLTHHAILNKWMQFGGHADGDEDIQRVGYKEGVEESGIENIKLLRPEIFDISFHTIAENPKKNEPSHSHYDVCYLFYVPDDTPYVVSDKSNDLKWFSLEEIKALNLTGRMPRLIKKWEKLLTSKAA